MIPAWTDENVMEEDTIKAMLTNPRYLDLGSESSKMFRTMAELKMILKDGGNYFIPQDEVKQIDAVKDMGIRSVAVTYAIYQITTKIPAMGKGDQIDACKKLRVAIEKKITQIPSKLDDEIKKYES